MGTTSRSTLADGARVAGRYRIERMLGRGGSATVYCATDELTGADVAIKHLLADAGSLQHALFQREYHTLAQLRHPAVISVFEYGVTPDGPFYTMELLDGHDLSELAPLPWVEACRVLCEVASALAILHSRRLIHRDVSHRNVRVASDGRTKLIDFGAMAPMGFVPDLIGTPPFVSPEAAYREPLDQRTDLYSLGALACWLLSGRHLYPAQTIRELRVMWVSGAPRVPEFPPDVPAKLQQLALALLQRDATARPSSAAEVIDRLIAIAGLPPSDSTSIASSYLINPKLIGRQFALDALKAELHNARAARRGGVLLIRGSYGAGKSRLLQEAVMQAQFAGFSVMQTGAHASASEPYAVIGRIVEALLQESPDVRLTSERREVLAWMLPELRQGSGVQTTLRPTQAEELGARVHAELVAFVLELAASQRLLIAIDDLHACDEESLAVLLGASRERARGPLILAALLDQGAAVAASVRLLCERAARVIDLRPLSVAETELLVESLFGSSPHSPRVAGWMHEHSRGNPLECMELARHLVERRAAYYMDGAWMLPSDLPAGVPSSLLDAFQARVAALPAAQRAIAELLALYGPPASLALCIELGAATLGAEHRLDDAELFRALDQLVGAELLLVNGDRYALSRDALREVLLSGLSPERRRELHQGIADVLIARGASDAAAKLEAGHHAMRGNSPLPGVALLEDAIKGQRRLGELGDAVVPALQLALELCERSDEPPARCMRLRARLVNCAVAYDKKLIAYADPLLEQLRQDSGLAFWPALPGTGRERLTRAIALAQQHHERTAPERRGLPPIEALTELAMVASAMLGVAIFGFDGATIDRLAEVVAPFEELDKKLALTVVYDLVILIQHIGHGRLRLGHAQRLELLARLRDPSSYHGLPDEARKATLATQLHALGMWQAPRDGAAALATADAIDALEMKAYEGAALQIRLIVHLYAGNAEAANACQLGIDSLAVRGGPGRQTEIWLLAYLVGPYAAWGDVIALKRTAERFAALVPDSPAYRAHMYTALGAYYRERGQLVESKRALEHALALARTFGPRITAISQYIETLIAAGEHARALELANRYFGEVEDDDSERAVFRHQLLPLTALAEARLGAVDAAAQQLDAAVAAADTPSRSMAWRVRLHEARARVAIEARDAAAFEAHAERVAELLRTVTSTTLLRHRMLLDDGARIGAGPRPAASPAARPEVTSSMPTVQERRSPTAQELARRADVRERCERALALLLGDVRALGGVLFADGPSGLEVMVKSADEAVSNELLEAAQSFADAAAQVEQPEAHADAWTSGSGGRYELLELQVPGAQGPALVGVAALRLPTEADHQTPSAVWLSAIARALQEAVELSTGRPFEAWMEM